jgi:hypothetical protein
MNMGGTEAGIVRSDTKFGGTHDIVWHGNWQGLTKSSFDLYNIMTKGKMPPKIGEHMMKWGIDKFGY